MRIRIIVALFCMACSAAIGSPMFRGIIAQNAGAGTGSSCTSSGDWTKFGSATSDPQTITVPGGNAGTLKFNVSKIAGAGTAQYCQNGSNSSCGGSTWTAFALGDTVTFANTDTLRFRVSGANLNTILEGEVIDNTTLAHVGDVDIELTAD